MSMRSFYVLCRLIVRLRHKDVSDAEISFHLLMSGLDVKDTDELMEMTRATG